MKFLILLTLTLLGGVSAAAIPSRQLAPRKSSLDMEYWTASGFKTACTPEVCTYAFRISGDAVPDLEVPAFDTICHGTHRNIYTGCDDPTIKTRVEANDDWTLFNISVIHLYAIYNDEVAFSRGQQVNVAEGDDFRVPLLPVYGTGLIMESE